METINTVNFEDLFDFSPEPVDRANANGQEDAEVKTGYYDHPPAAVTSAPGPGTTSSSVPVVAHRRRLDNDDNRESNNVFADFEAVLAGHFAEDKKDYKLSTSVPSNWSGGASSTPSSSADTSGGRVFTVGSVGQLLNDLPEASVSGERQDGTAAASAPPTKSKRGRKPGQRSLRTDMKTKLERSRQSARECRARKKLRYQYLDDLILEREKANDVLREELIRYQKWCHELDKGRIPDGLQNLLKEVKEGQ